MPDNKTAPNYRVPALEKGLDVLEILAEASKPLSLSQISDVSGKSTSELFRTLNCLVERDYVVKDDVTGRYWLTLKLFEMANRHSPMESLLKAADVPMQELALELGESCHISIVHRGRLLVLAQADSPKKIRISIAAGSTFSLVTTVSGRLLLAAMDHESATLLANDVPDYQAMSDAERTSFWERIAEIRRTGASMAVDDSFIGLRDTAVLVGNPAVGVVAALAVTQLTAAVSEKNEQGRVLGTLRACAERITEQVGLTYPTELMEGKSV